MANRLSLSMVRRPNFLFFDQNMIKVDLTKSHGNKIKSSKSVKYLGVYINKNLSWDCHINELCKKLSISNGIIAKLRHYVSKNTHMSVYYSIFYAHLSSGCHVWSLTTKTTIDLVVKLQKKCIRIINFSSFNVHNNG